MRNVKIPSVISNSNPQFLGNDDDPLQGPDIFRPQVNDPNPQFLDDTVVVGDIVKNVRTPSLDHRYSSEPTHAAAVFKTPSLGTVVVGGPDLF